MALQSKIANTAPVYVPGKLTLIKERGANRVRAEVEPIKWHELNDITYQLQWGEFLNTMHLYENENIVSRDDLFPVFVQYLRIKKYTQEQIAAIRVASENDITYSIVSKAFLLMSTGVDHPNCVATDKWLTSKIKAALANPTIKPAVQRGRNAQDALRDKRSELLGELQGLEDDAQAGSNANILQFLTERSVPHVHLNRIVEMFAPRLVELQEVLTTTDKELKEAYAHLSKPLLKHMISFYERLLNDVEQYKGVKVATRKKIVRAPRVKAPIKVIKNLNYMSSCAELGISSADPKKLVGCQQAWLYNTKTRMLIVYQASEQEKQMTVRGTSLVGWEEAASYMQKLRKPEAQLAEFMAGGKVERRTFMKNLKTTQVKVRGRINEDMLILKVT